jgi:hypothetical protein
MLKSPGGRCSPTHERGSRVSRNEPDFPDAGQIVCALIAANPDRLVWGTDGPHTASHGHVQGSDPPLIDYRPLDDGHLIDLLADWVNDTAVLEKVLVTNPARLYGGGDHQTTGKSAKAVCSLPRKLMSPHRCADWSAYHLSRHH